MVAVWLLLALVLRPQPAGAAGGSSASPRASAAASPLFLGVGLDPTGRLGLSAPVARALVNGSPPSAEASAGLVNIHQPPEEANVEPGFGIG